MSRFISRERNSILIVWLTSKIKKRTFRPPEGELSDGRLVLYFADKLHMERYGRSICGDTYIAMKFGPVPSGTYDLIKDVRRHRTHSNNYDHAAASFQLVGDDRIKVIRDVNEDLFSDSDIECLNQSIQEHGSKPFDVLANLPMRMAKLLLSR